MLSSYTLVKMRGKPSKEEEIIADPSAPHAWNEAWQRQPSEDNFLINSGIGVMQVKMGRTLEAGDGPGVQSRLSVRQPLLLILAKACRQAKEIVCSPWNVA